MLHMNKVLIRVYSIAGVVLGICGIGFLGIALYAEQSFVKVVALISASCLLLACVLLVSLSIATVKIFRNRNNVDESRK